MKFPCHLQLVCWIILVYSIRSATVVSSGEGNVTSGPQFEISCGEENQDIKCSENATDPDVLLSSNDSGNNATASSIFDTVTNATIAEHHNSGSDIGLLDSSVANFTSDSLFVEELSSTSIEVATETIPLLHKSTSSKPTSPNLTFHKPTSTRPSPPKSTLQQHRLLVGSSEIISPTVTIESSTSSQEVTTATTKDANIYESSDDDNEDIDEEIGECVSEFLEDEDINDGSLGEEDVTTGDLVSGVDLDDTTTTTEKMPNARMIPSSEDVVDTRGVYTGRINKWVFGNIKNLWYQNRSGESNSSDETTNSSEAVHRDFYRGRGGRMSRGRRMVRSSSRCRRVILQMTFTHNSYNSSNDFITQGNISESRTRLGLNNTPGAPRRYSSGTLSKEKNVKAINIIKSIKWGLNSAAICVLVLTLFTFGRAQRKSQSSITFVMALNMFELVAAILAILGYTLKLSLPDTSQGYVLYTRWVSMFVLVVCRRVVYLLNLLMVVQRLIVVARPFSARTHFHLCTNIITIVLVAATTCAAHSYIPLTYNIVSRGPGQYRISYSSIYKANTKRFELASTICKFLFAFLPLILSLVGNFLLILFLKRHEKTAQNLRAVNQLESVRSRHVSRMIVVSSMSFTLLCLPVNTHLVVVYYVLDYGPYQKEHYLFKVVHQALLGLLTLGDITNFICYISFNPRFREQLVSALHPIVLHSKKLWCCQTGSYSEKARLGSINKPASVVSLVRVSPKISSGVQCDDSTG